MEREGSAAGAEGMNGCKEMKSPESMNFLKRAYL